MSITKKPDIDPSYLDTAKGLLDTKDLHEIASALMVRDHACALYVTAMKLLDEPEDADVCEFLSNIVPVESGTA